MKHYVSTINRITDRGAGSPNCAKVSIFPGATKALLEKLVFDTEKSYDGQNGDFEKYLSFDCIIGEDIVLSQYQLATSTLRRFVSTEQEFNMLVVKYNTFLEVHMVGEETGYPNRSAVVLHDYFVKYGKDRDI
uniref:Phage protein n=1 Tax=Rhabditophanes sp. KR3021 TaxID=114890 RepID=A0AC35TMJ5_9BILA